MIEQDILDAVIVGGGLSGLLIAHGLQRTHTNWLLIDARDVLGGRLVNDNHGDCIDLGGTWIWPKAQPYMRRLLKELSIKTFAQPDDPSSARIAGGAVQVIRRLVARLPKDRLQLNTPVSRCCFVQQTSTEGQNNGHYVCLTTSNQQTIYTRRVIFAVPPKLLSKHVEFEPPLSQEKQLAMAASQTWMAGVTKISLVYPEKFWDHNYSNMSLGNGGPAFHVYDASSSTMENSGSSSVWALTFFTLIPSTSSAYTDDTALATQVSQQISDVWTYMRRKDFAYKADSYTHFHVQRWPLDQYISEDDKPVLINPHPTPVPALSDTEWGGALFFAGSETDHSSPGLMEGAVGSSLRVLKELESALAVGFF